MAKSDTTIDDEPRSGDVFHFRERSTLMTLLLVLACTASVVVGNGSMAMVSISMPIIARDLDIPQSRLQWLASAYSLSSGCLLLLFGRVADLYGRRRVWLVGTLWLAAFSLGCGFAPNDIALDVLRGIAGMSMAATVPASLGILAHSFPPGRTRSFAMATFAAGAPLGAVVGWVVSAPLVQYTERTWRSAFFLMTGLAILVFVLGLLSIDRDPPLSQKGSGDRTIDWVGAALVTVGLILLSFSLAQGESAPQGWRTPYIIALLVISPFFIAAFLTWEWYYEHRLGRTPLLRIGLWTRGHGTFAVVQAIAFFEFCAFTAWTFWTTLFYQQLLHKEPVQVMVRFLPMIITGVTLNVIVGLFVAHIPMVYLVVLGTGATAVACLLFAVINEHASYWAFNFPAAILSVFGADFVFASGAIFVARVALPGEQSVAGGLFQTLIQLGSAFGLAISTIAHDAGVRRALHGREDAIIDGDLNTAPHDAQLQGYRDGFWACFAFAAFAMVLGALFLWRVGIVGDKNPTPTLTEEVVNEKEQPAQVPDMEQANASTPAITLDGTDGKGKEMSA
ncbi:putative efflux transporter [Auricularia subglabra TFB-10046 SS5]|nr:putative efflux transporter [Auricularia subglabra TFB-10046 SS5]